MAIYHFSAKVISRATGRSAVAAAAYRAAQGKAPAVPASSGPSGGGLDPKAAQRALAKVEAEIAKAEAAKASVEAEMAAPDLYARPAEFAATMARFQQVEEAVKALYARWEALAAQADA